MRATINDVINYVEKKPIRASLEVQFRPAFTYHNNERDIILQILMQLCLIGRADQINKIRAVVNPDQASADISKNMLNALFTIFEEEAKDDAITPEKTTALKKLKKHIHAYAELMGVDLKSHEAERIVNLKKLLERNNAADQVILSQYLDQDKKLKQAYAVVKNIAPITTKEVRQKRQTAKIRINRASVLISVIVGIGEGMIAAVFAAAAWPFLTALLVVGIPALLCNYFLFRGASFFVMKEIYFGKSTDDKKTKTLKGVSTFFSAMAGLTSGFLSYGSVSIAFGHLLFGLTAAAALAAPPVGLIVLAVIIAGVTAVAITTLYDFTIRSLIDKGIKNILVGLKNDFVNFIKPDNGKSFSELSLKEKAKHIAKKTLQGLLHCIFYAVATVVSGVVILAIMPIMRHKATAILHGTFQMANQLAHTVSQAITIGMGSLVNGFFYSKQVVGVANVIKKIAYAIWYPRNAADAMKKTFNNATANTYTKAQAFCTSVKRLFLFGTVVMNSVVGQGVGASKSVVAQDTVSRVLPVNNVVASDLIAVGISAASGYANADKVIQGTKPIEYVSPLRQQGLFKKPPEDKHRSESSAVLSCSR